ncbi:hypothetical protein ACJ73_07101 [Blastomyces percursus]|uniref:Uncharacterized protein n=1 Tax=Blastomyces percursus TaxID=1658174 RepID=A0A1J9PZ10_9EURO|nr:hypothetical protein ACJ73_07101 [Blastomyces percursus]
MMMMRYMMEGMGGYHPYTNLHANPLSNPPLNLPLNTPFNPSNPLPSNPLPSNPLPSNPPPSNPSPLRSSPIPHFGEHEELFFNEYFSWLTRWRPSKASRIREASFILQNEGFELDHLRRLTKEQLNDMNIGAGIYQIIRNGLKEPLW